MPKENHQNPEAPKWLQPILRFLIEKVGVNSFLLTLSDIFQERPLLSDNETPVPDPLEDLKHAIESRKELRNVETMNNEDIKTVVKVFFDDEEVMGILQSVTKSKINFSRRILDLSNFEFHRVRKENRRDTKSYKFKMHPVVKRSIFIDHLINLNIKGATPDVGMCVRLSVISPSSETKLKHSMELTIFYGIRSELLIKSVNIDTSHGFTVTALKKALTEVINKLRRSNGLTLG